MRTVMLGAVVAFGWAWPATAQVTGYEALADWTSLPRDRTQLVAGLASSYDRAGGNDDFNHYHSPTGFQGGTLDPVVVTELTGPGVLTRFWMPHATANAARPLRVFVDDVLRIDTNTNTYLDGNYGYASAPLTRTLVGGQVSYEPIGFQRSLRIESANGAGSHYYQWNYQSLPAGTAVASYTNAPSPQQQSARAAAVATVNRVGQDPAGPPAGSTVLAAGAQSIGANAALTLIDQTGSGRIRRLNVAPAAGASDAQLDGLRVRVRYDGSTQNAIDVPVSHFFGAGHGRAAYKSLPLGTDSPNGFYSHWPMPFRQAVHVELYNGTGAAIPLQSAAVEVQEGAVGPDEGYLYAQHGEQTTTAGQTHYQLLDVEGSGHYVGNLLYVEKPRDYREILEGDDVITVNPGAPDERVLHGTGLEDAYNGGYYYNHVAEQNDDGDIPDPESGAGPFSGLLNIDLFDSPDFALTNRTRADQYRWMISDAVPFTDGLDVRIENFTDTAGTLFGSTAFYYAVPEPSGMLLLVVCSAIVGASRRRHR